MPSIEVFDFTANEQQRHEAVEAITGGLQQAFAIPAEIITIYFFETAAGSYAHAGVLRATSTVRRVFIKIHALHRNIDQKREAAALVTAGTASAYGVDPTNVAVYFFDRASDQVAHAGRLECDRQDDV